MHGFKSVPELIFVTRSSRKRSIGVKANITRTCVVFMLHSKVKTIIFTWFTDNQDWQQCCSCTLVASSLRPHPLQLHLMTLRNVVETNPFGKIFFSKERKKAIFLHTHLLIFNIFSRISRFHHMWRKIRGVKSSRLAFFCYAKQWEFKFDVDLRV